MTAIPASASNALQALSHQEMFVGDTPVDVPSLRQSAERAREAGWTDAFVLDTRVPDDRISVEESADLLESCLASAYLVKDVWVVTASFGYKAGSTASHPQTPVAPDEKLANLFGDPEGLTRFRAFAHTTQGAALVLQFDAELIVERLATLGGGNGTLAEHIAADSTLIRHRPVRDLLTITGPNLLTYRALHAVEHAVLLAAMRQLGTDTLGSRLFPASATVVLFEKSKVGRGGVIQLVNHGLGLTSLVHAARDLMVGCSQGCTEGCPACVYIRDQHCSHPLDDLGAEWLPSNALLSRAGAAAILSSDAAH